MLVKFLRKFKPTRNLIYQLGRLRSHKIIRKFDDYLNKDDKILDIGSGTCNICELLREDGYSVTPVDVQNLSFVDGLNPKIYDGETLPYEDKQFDVAIMILIRHHALNPEKVLAEATRVAKRVIVMEEIYSNDFQKYFTYFVDSVENLDFFSNPHSNKHDVEWQDCLRDLGMKIERVDYHRGILCPLLREVTYCAG